MSLKAVHLAFIFTATLTAFGFGVWALRSGPSMLSNAGAWGGASIASGLLLTVYFIWFFNKVRRSRV